MDVPKLIQTGDGSHSLYIRELNETYHSTHGALSESKHVFLSSGVQYWLNKENSKSIRILEIGFGTGLNALMMLDFARAQPDLDIEFCTLEPFPLPEELYTKLNFTDLMENVHASDLVKMHSAPMGEQVILGNFEFIKHDDQVQEAQLKNNFTVVFFDAFAPNKQPEMWDIAVIRKMYEVLIPGGVFVTYCAQGQFKRDLKSVGFEVQTLEGPPGKKEMVRGLKN